ncbi:MAG: hypothetical protein EZS28_003007 [Streblomastix strix]|uniref:Uncharacterized protein n=1 Tax=Streblomastix strix TaxID=222440 RepID=A0A5J4X346_9EUKA|nr:MAG: hypothetical protein EZS28_003007 [Streblomastix strix]
MGRGRKRRRVISSKGSGNGQNNDDWDEGLHCKVNRQHLREFRIQCKRREQAIPPIQSITGAHMYIPTIRTAQEDPFVEQMTSLQTSTKRELFLRQVMNQLIKN